jgi:hypothetical protein
MSTFAAQAISTRRLDLLPLDVEHAEEMAAVLSDPALHAFIGSPAQALPAPDGRLARSGRLMAELGDPAP